MECLSPNIHVPDLSAGPKKKRFQVHAACTQCKKSHAACSMTRPCERCVRVGEAHLCVDQPRKRRGKQNPPPSVNHIPLEPPSINPSHPDDAITPIDEISDFLFDGIENHLLADSALRNVSLLEGSTLDTQTLLHSRPLFPNPYSSLNLSSPSTSSDTLSPVPSSPVNANGSPLPHILKPDYINYTPDAASAYMSPNITHNISHYASIQSLGNSNPSRDLYDYSHHITDETLINAHINSLLSAVGVHSPSTSTTSSVSSPSLSSEILSSSEILAPSAALSPSLSSTAVTTRTHSSTDNHTSTSCTHTHTHTTPSPSSCCIASSTSESSIPGDTQLLGIDATGVHALGQCEDSSCKLHHCFCNKVTPEQATSGKVHIVCAPGNHDCEVPSEKTSLHLVVESLMREVQSLKREMRGETPAPTNPIKIGSTTPGGPPGPAVAVWDMVDQRLLECNETFATLFCVDPAHPIYLTDIAQCPAYFLRMCAANKTTWHERRRYSLKRPEGDINLVVAIDINGTCVVTTVWKAE